EGVSVTHLAPGFIATDARKRDGGKDPIPLWLQMRADVAAQQMVSAVLARRAQAVVTLHGKFTAMLAAFIPLRLIDLGYRLASPPNKSVQHVVHGLRQGKQRHDQGLPP